MAQQSTRTSVLVEKMPDLVRSRVAEAEILLANEKYDAASYLCGYAVEWALKKKISERFGWSEYPPPTHTAGERTKALCDDTNQELYNKLVKVHKLTQLLCLSGITEDDMTRFDLYRDWEVVKEWNPENRYTIGPVNLQEAQDMIEAVKRLSAWLLGTPL